MSHDPVRHGPLEVRRGAQMTTVISHPQHNEIGVALFCRFQNPRGGLSVFHYALGTAPQLRILRDDFMKFIHEVGYRRHTAPVRDLSIAFVDHMQKDQPGLILLGQ